MNLKHKINVIELPTPHSVYTLSLVAKVYYIIYVL